MQHPGWSDMCSSSITVGVPSPFVSCHAAAAATAIATKQALHDVGRLHMSLGRYLETGMVEYSASGDEADGDDGDEDGSSDGGEGTSASSGGGAVMARRRRVAAGNPTVEMEVVSGRDLPMRAGMKQKFYDLVEVCTMVGLNVGLAWRGKGGCVGVGIVLDLTLAVGLLSCAGATGYHRWLPGGS